MSASTTEPLPPRQPSRLWLWFVAAFIVQAIAWAALFTVASHHKVAEVPLVESP